MKQDYLGKCEMGDKTYSVLIIAELWFMEDEILPEESIKELKQYDCTVF